VRNISESTEEGLRYTSFFEKSLCTGVANGSYIASESDCLFFMEYMKSGTEVGKWTVGDVGRVWFI
jgi:hypothetical protein